MPRQSRQKSPTGLYHITMRGVNKNDIFLDDEDYSSFLGYLQSMKIASGLQIYAYCLMKNHIHLLLKEEKEDLAISFRRLGAGFVGWYNRKYKRVGHLFQSRYSSEIIDKDAYFLAVLRYIHQNPVKAGIVEEVTDYRWSSIHEYCSWGFICNTEEAFAYFQSNNVKSYNTLNQFLLAQEYEDSIHVPGGRKLPFEQAKECLSKTGVDVSWEERYKLSEEQKWQWAETMLQQKIPVVNIVNLTGISRFRLNKCRL